MEDLRKEEQCFVDFLKSANVRELNDCMGDAIFQNEQRMNFKSMISAMVNSYGCSEKKIVEAISSNKNAVDCFYPLALHFVMQCACRYKPDYWDDRDKRCVEVCNRIVSLDSFKFLYERMCVEQYTPDAGRCPLKSTSKAAALVGSLCDMHSTLRQTFCNVVLTFLLSQSVKLRKEVLSREILHSETVHFFMI